MAVLGTKPTTISFGRCDVDRRDFLKAALIAIAGSMPISKDALALAPQYLYPEPNLEQAILVVRPWIVQHEAEYCDDPEPKITHPEVGPLQIFRTDGGMTFTARSATELAMTEEKFLRDLFCKHIDTIAANIVLSQQYVGVTTPEGSPDDFGVPIRMLRGFKQRYGRMPIPGDEGHLLCLKNRRMHMMKWMDPMSEGQNYTIITECTFKMDRLA